MILTIIKMALLLACVVLQVFILYNESKTRPLLNNAIDVIARYCMKHDCDGCKFWKEKEGICALEITPCDWRRTL